MRSSHALGGSHNDNESHNHISGREVPIFDQNSSDEEDESISEEQ